MGKQTLKERIPAFASILGLLVLIAAYYIVGAIRDANVAYGLKAIVNQSVVVALVATGAVFISYNATGSLVIMFLVCVGVAVAIGFINSSLASVFNLPIFVTTVAMMSVLSAFMLILIGWNGAGDTIKVKARDVRPLDNIPFKVGILVAYIALCWFVFTLLPTGREAKFIGGNPVCARLSGINEKKLAIIASLISAIGIGLGAFLTIVYAPTLNKDTASSIGMDVIIAIVFGGMPVSGGPRSRILSAVVGAFSMGFLSQIMSMLNLGSGYGQMIKAAIFLLVVFIALGSQRGKLLTR